MMGTLANTKTHPGYLYRDQIENRERAQEKVKSVMLAIITQAVMDLDNDFKYSQPGNYMFSRVSTDARRWFLERRIHLIKDPFSCRSVCITLGLNYKMLLKGLSNRLCPLMKERNPPLEALRLRKFLRTTLENHVRPNTFMPKKERNFV